MQTNNHQFQKPFLEPSLKSKLTYQHAFNILRNELNEFNQKFKLSEGIYELIENVLYDIKHDIYEIKQAIFGYKTEKKNVYIQTDIQSGFIEQLSKKENKEHKEITDYPKVENNKCIKKVENVHINPIEHIRCITLLSDLRIAYGTFDGNMKIGYLDSLNFQWKNQINKIKAHNYCINCINELDDKKIASCSNDCTIKIWNVSIPNNINLITIIPAASKEILQVIPLSGNRLASISKDKTIKIWKSKIKFFNETKYEQLSTSFEIQNNYPTAICQLKNKEIICISICNSDNPKEINKGEILFFDLCSPFNMKGIIKEVFTGTKNGMIQLRNEKIVIHQHYPLSKILVVDSSNYKIIKEIVTGENINENMYGFLCLNSNDSFLYIHKENISVYEVLRNEYILRHKTKRIEEDTIWDGITTQNGKYIIIATSKKGLNVYEIKL